MVLIYFVRHGDPEWTLAEQRKLRGYQCDMVPLTPTGIRQIESTTLDLRLRDSELILSSPILERCSLLPL